MSEIRHSTLIHQRLLGISENLMTMDLSVTAQYWVNLFFLWLGFGIVVGMTAQIVLPSGEPKGTFGVLVIGVAGSCLGPFLISRVLNLENFNPIGPLGFFVSVLVALGILLLYRFLLTLFRKTKQPQV